MVMEDIGYTIFAQFLGMAEYPGSPFTGNLFRDLIMFLIVPTIFIILVIYTMTGRIIADSKIRLMLGLGAFLFIVAGGYYRTFALLSGPYFIFLIFIMGLLYFLLGHFRGPHGGGGGGAGGGGRYQSHSSYPEDVEYAAGDSKKLRRLIGIPTLDPVERKYLKDELHDIHERIRAVEKQIAAAEKTPGTGDIGRMTETLDRLIKERQGIEYKLGIGRN